MPRDLAFWKDRASPTLLRAMRAVGSRPLTAVERVALDRYFASTLAGLVDEILDRGFGRWGITPNELTPRQLEVVRLWADGHDTTAVARSLHISLHTAQTHSDNIRGRLRARTQAQAVAIAASRGLLP